MLKRLQPKTRLFKRDSSGIAALEFAMIAPMLLILYMGASDAALAVSLNRKLEGTASTVGDLVGQEETVTKSQLKLILGISQALIQPFDSTKLSAIVTSVTIDANGTTKVDWSSASGSAVAYTKGATFSLPSSFATHRSRSLVVAETLYTYQPLGGYGFDAVIPMKSISYLTPRNTTTAIKCSDC
ncbi:TadE/TadG family type IV pilus assembly protein [Aureimonas sp. AU4]|uniref:TadE/TadG family type IV pilus assembly protein n=1 Tax=Aureimonas sp. AU4 TaxID=1638163 RepID=UPI0007823658|nr:TadE/TadG family type IV pilus assembly protein [Aureimonas sp. AU4]